MSGKVGSVCASRLSARWNSLAWPDPTQGLSRARSPGHAARLLRTSLAWPSRVWPLRTGVKLGRSFLQ